jgi:hypothetical protein
MDEQQNQSGIAEKVVSSLSKDFKIVGTQRVHPWFAWAIVGVVFGMALGVVYVSNQSGQFGQSQAASFDRRPQSTDALACTSVNTYTFAARTRNELREFGGVYEPFTSEEEEAVYTAWVNGEKDSTALKAQEHGKTGAVTSGEAAGVEKGDKAEVSDVDGDGKTTLYDVVESMRKQAAAKCEASKSVDRVAEQQVKPTCKASCVLSDSLHISKCGDVVFGRGAIAAVAYPQDLKYTYTANCSMSTASGGPGTPGGNNNGGPTTGGTPPAPTTGGITSGPKTPGTGCSLVKNKATLDMRAAALERQGKNSDSVYANACKPLSCPADASKQCSFDAAALAAYKKGPGSKADLEKVCTCPSGSTTTGEPQQVPKEPSLPTSPTSPAGSVR